MKIAWFTPFSRTSSIARCSELITRELARSAEVEIWHPPCGDPRYSELPCRVLGSGAEVSLDTWNDCDALVYNLGNHLPFHKQIWELSRRRPGITILHDFVMRNFLVDYFIEESREPEKYFAAMRRHYGPAGAKEARLGFTGAHPLVWETPRAAEFPLFEEVIDGALGVVVHAQFLEQRVRAVFSGPVLRLGLPHDVAGLGLSLSRADLNVPEDAILLVTIGHVNLSKRIPQIIETLAAMDDLRGRIHYLIVGPWTPNQKPAWDDLIAKHGLGETVHFTGYASDELLHACVRHADICLNLRYPAMEGASGSAVEEMLHGKPIIVNDVGFYSELPDNAVLKIKPGAEKEQLAPAIRRLVGDAKYRRRLAANALKYANAHFRASLYAQGMLDFIAEVGPQSSILSLTGRLSQELHRMGVHAGDELLDSVSAAAFEEARIGLGGYRAAPGGFSRERRQNRAPYTGSMLWSYAAG